MSINHFTVSGNLTKDAEVRQTANGMTVLNFSVAVNERKKDQATGQWEDVPNFFDCVMFGNYAKAVANRMVKGTKVCLDGRLHMRSWERDGQRRSKVELNVNDVEIMPRQQTQSQQSFGQQTYGQQTYEAHSLYDEEIPF